jgi:pyruvate/2-oxoglutarate/acetoin dehydrogenase E1 component
MSTATKEMTIRDAINSALDEELERDPKVFIIGASRAPGARSRARALRAHV